MIVGWGSLARLRARFRDQFTPAQRGWTYRRGGRGPALPVSDEDQAAFVAGFDRAARWLCWGGVLTVMIASLLLQAVGVEPRSGAVLVPFLLVWCALFWWAWNAPHRWLDGRAPVARALTGGEARRNGLRSLPWGVLAAGAGVSLILIGRVALLPGPREWGYVALGFALLALFAAIALAKRRATSVRPTRR